MLYLTSYLETNVAKYMSAIFYYSTMIHMYLKPEFRGVIAVSSRKVSMNP
jgi:hypothetical protein